METTTVRARTWALTRPHQARLRVLIALALTLLVVVATAAESAPSERSTSPVLTIPPPGPPSVVGSSHVVRTDNGVSVRLESSGLEPGHAVTLWIIAANSPEDCEAGIPGLSQCGPADHEAGRGDISVHQGTGRIARDDGTAAYGAHLRVGDRSQALFEDDPGLLDPRGAEVLLILKTHGPKIPELTSDMLSTFAGGCADQSFPPSLTPNEDLVGEAGPNDCAEIQISVHQPS